MQLVGFHGKLKRRASLEFFCGFADACSHSITVLIIQAVCTLCLKVIYNFADKYASCFQIVCSSVTSRLGFTADSDFCIIHQF